MPQKSNIIMKNIKKKVNNFRVRLFFWLKKYWHILFFFIFSLLTFYLIVKYDCKKTINEKKISEIIQTVGLLSSIISGIIISYLISKVIQIRQEKNDLKPALWELTKKVHYFRKIIHKVFNKYDFWPNGIHQYISRNYPNLTYYDVRDIIYVDKDVSEQANKFIQDSKFGEIKKQAFLEMKSFLLPLKYFDETVYSEFDVELMYSTDTLNKWQEYDCGNMIWYLFENEYVNYEGQFNFNALSNEKKEIEQLSRKIDFERYRNINFGPKLLGKLGSQIDLDIIPKLNSVQHKFEKGLPKIVKFMYSVLSLMLLFGVIIPIISILFDFPNYIAFISISVIINLTLIFIIKFPDIMKNEIYVD